MKTKEWVKEFVSDRAQNYDNHIYNFMPGYEAFQGLILNLIKTQQKQKNIQQPKILIVGAGTGNEALKLATKIPESKILAIDPSEDMILSLKTKVKSLNNVQCQQCFLGEVKDLNFDFVVASLVMHFIEDNGEKENFLNDVYGKLNDNGTYIVVDKMSHGENDKELLDYWQGFMTQQHGMAKDAKRTREMVAKELNRISEHRLLELSKQVGFTKAQEFFRALHVQGFILEK